MSRQQVPNRELAADVGRANILTNGGFEVWQRGNGPVTYGGNADQWFLYDIGSGAVTFEKNTTSQETGTACLLEKITVSSGSIHIVQKLENPLTYRGKTLSLSVRVNPNTNGMMRAEIYDGVTGFWTNVSSGTGWQTLSRTATISATATCVWVFITGLAVGQCYIDSAMLVFGAVPTDYVPLRPDDDLMRCMRYYEVIGEPGAGDWIIRGYSPAAGTCKGVNVRFRARKISAPTVTKVGTWVVNGMDQPNPVSISAEGFRVDAFTTAVVSDAYVFNAGTGCCFTAEANVP